MKKNSFGLVSAVLVGTACILVGCGSTNNVTTSNVSAEVKASASENNTSVQARETKIVDWQDRTIGAKVNPEWLLGIVRGNGNLYVQMYGLNDEYANHKWFTVSAQNRALANAQTEAETEVLQRLGQEMANTINSTIGTNLSDGQKDSVRNICSKVNNVKLTGIGERGTYWQLERTKDEYGNVQNLYNFYVIYSCDRSTYNKLLNTYMIELLKSKELDETAVSAIKQNAQQILNDAQEQSARVEKAKEREWKMQLVHEETERKLAREETLRQQSASFAQAAANAGPYTSVHMDGAGNAEMDPALAALIGAM